MALFDSKTPRDLVVQIVGGLVVTIVGGVVVWWLVSAPGTTAAPPAPRPETPTAAQAVPAPEAVPQAARSPEPVPPALPAPRPAPAGAPPREPPVVVRTETKPLPAARATQLPTPSPVPSTSAAAEPRGAGEKSAAPTSADRASGTNATQDAKSGGGDAIKVVQLPPPGQQVERRDANVTLTAAAAMGVAGNVTARGGAAGELTTARHGPGAEILQAGCGSLRDGEWVEPPAPHPHLDCVVREIVDGSEKLTTYRVNAAP